MQSHGASRVDNGLVTTGVVMYRLWLCSSTRNTVALVKREGFRGDRYTFSIFDIMKVNCLASVTRVIRGKYV